MGLLRFDKHGASSIVMPHPESLYCMKQLLHEPLV